MNAFEQKRRARTLWVALIIILGFLPWIFPWTKWFWIPVSAWALLQYVLQYYIGKPFQCARCRHLKCTRHRGLVISPDTIICTKCASEAADLAERVDKVHKIADSISDAFAEHEFPIKYSVDDTPNKK